MPMLEIKPNPARRANGTIILPNETLWQVGALVRVSVRATNATACGVVSPDSIIATAMLDTGAMGTVVDKSIVRLLGAPQKDEILVVAGGFSERRGVFSVEIEIPRLARFELDVTAAQLHPILQCQVILGRDVLRYGTFRWDGQAGQAFLSLVDQAEAVERGGDAA